MARAFQIRDHTAVRICIGRLLLSGLDALMSEGGYLKRVKRPSMLLVVTCHSITWQSPRWHSCVKRPWVWYLSGYNKNRYYMRMGSMSQIYFIKIHFSWLIINSNIHSVSDNFKIFHYMFRLSWLINIV